MRFFLSSVIATVGRKYILVGRSRCRMETVKNTVMETVKKTVYNKQWNK